MTKQQNINKNMAKSNDGGKTIIGENTSVKVSLIVAFLVSFGSAVWWSSSISSKLDALIAAQNGTVSSITELKSKDISLDKEIADFKLTQALIQVELKSLKDSIPSLSKK